MTGSPRPRAGNLPGAEGRAGSDPGRRMDRQAAEKTEAQPKLQE